MKKVAKGRSVGPDEMKEWLGLVGEPKVVKKGKGNQSEQQKIEQNKISDNQQSPRYLQDDELLDWEHYLSDGFLPTREIQKNMNLNLNLNIVKKRQLETKKFVQPSPIIQPLNRSYCQRLARGKISPECTLDLHGFHVNEAVKELNKFIAQSLYSNYTLVLVITGKGSGFKSNCGSNIGVLNKMLPQFLMYGPHSRRIRHYCYAHSSHGGSGAYYVVLQKQKRNQLCP